MFTRTYRTPITHSSHTHCTPITHPSHSHHKPITHQSHTHHTLIIHPSYTHHAPITHPSQTHITPSHTHHTPITHPSHTYHTPITHKSQTHHTPTPTPHPTPTHSSHSPLFPHSPLLLHILYQLQFITFFWHNCIHRYSLYQYRNSDQGSQCICMYKNMQEFYFRIKVKYAAVQFEGLFRFPLNEIFRKNMDFVLLPKTWLKLGQEQGFVKPILTSAALHFWRGFNWSQEQLHTTIKGKVTG